MEGHGPDLIATIAIGLGAAFVGGFLARLVKLPSIVGYLLAGVAVGPFTPGFVRASDGAPGAPRSAFPRARGPSAG